MITQIFSYGITYSNTMFYGGFMTFDEFSKKEVICVKDCRKLGHVVDLEFDECSGCICKIIVREHCGFWGFWNVGEEICIPFCKIKQIGPDIILVDV